MYFTANDLNELKKEYRKFAKELHPDGHPKTEAETWEQKFKEMSDEFNSEWARISRGEARKAGRQEKTEKQYNQESTEYAWDYILKELMKAGNIKIEVCGSWIWVESGKENKEILKKLGFKWGSQKKLWYWYPEGSWKKTSHKFFSMEEIRNRHGSQIIKDDKK